MLGRLINVAHKVISRIEKRLPSRSLKIGSRQFQIPTAIFAGVTHWSPNWKSHLIEKILASRANPVFLDVGTNVGQTLLDFLAADSGGSYFGFEPSPACAAQVQRIIDLNNVSNAFVFPLCLLDRTDIVTFYRNRDADTDESATTVNDLRPQDVVSKCFVPAFSLDVIANKQEWSAIDLIKIDVEGAEGSVLSGMSLTLEKFRPIILCEVLLADNTADMAAYAKGKQELFSILDTAKYAVFNIIKSETLEFVKIEKRDKFPIEVWTEDRSQQCDYLFVPFEKVQTLSL